MINWTATLFKDCPFHFRRISPGSLAVRQVKPPTRPPVKESTNLDDLAFLERQLLISSVGIRRHGHGVIVKESHKHSGQLLRLQVVVVVLGAPSPSVPVPTGAIWNIEEASAATASLVQSTLAIKAPRAQDVSLRADGERATRCLRMRKSHVEPFSARRYQCVFVLFKRRSAMSGGTR